MRPWLRNLLIVVVVAAGIAALVIPRLDIELVGSEPLCEDVEDAETVRCNSGDGRALADSLVVAGSIGAILLIRRVAPAEENDAEGETAPVAG